MVNAGDLLAHSGRRVIAAYKLSTTGRKGEYASRQQGACVRIDHAVRNRVIGEGLPRYDSGGRRSAGAVRAEVHNVRRDRNNVRLAVGQSSRDHRACSGAARIRVFAGQWNGLVGQSALNDAAPFHVIEEESWVFLPYRNLPSGVQTENI